MGHETGQGPDEVQVGIPVGEDALDTPVDLVPEVRGMVPGHQDHHQPSGEVDELETTLQLDGAFGNLNRCLHLNSGDKVRLDLLMTVKP